MSSDHREQLILNAIDQLRNRKARPDLDHISRLVRRRHGLQFPETAEVVDSLVAEGLVIKVDFKGSASYRHAAKWKKKCRNRQFKNSKETHDILRCAIEAVVSHGVGGGRDVSGEPGGTIEESSRLDEEATNCGGASFTEIQQWIEGNADNSSWLKTHLKTALNREVECGNVEQLENHRYMVLKIEIQSPPPPPAQPQASTPTVSTPSSPALSKTSVPPSSPDSFQPDDHDQHHLLDEYDEEKGAPETAGLKTTTASGSSHSRKGRPLGSGKKRKKLNMTKHSSNRRTQSPSVAQQPQQTIYNNAGDEVKCRLCYLDAEFNRYGYPEDMLTCKECRTTVHPSCMNYSSDLARRARDSPWQCYECKTCCICNEAGDPAELLFCDACDKGYHMQCHDPKISENPTGKWACARCAEQYGDIMATSDSNQDLVMFTSLAPDSTFLDKNGNQKDASLIENMCANFDIKRLCSICTVDWTIDDVTEFITKIGFSEQAENFKEQEIDGKSLLLLKRNDVLTGLSLKLGPALKIYEHIHNIQSVAGGF